jgi:hypothetical protein
MDFETSVIALLSVIAFSVVILAVRALFPPKSVLAPGFEFTTDATNQGAASSVASIQVQR